MISHESVCERGTIQIWKGADVMTFSQRIEYMRSGGKIKCPRCKEGYVSAVGNPKETNYFACPCGCRIILTNKLELDM